MVTCQFDAEPHELDDECQNVAFVSSCDRRCPDEKPGREASCPYGCGGTTSDPGGGPCAECVREEYEDGIEIDWEDEW